MKNVIKSEIYRNFKSWYFKLCFFGGCLFISVVTIFLPELANVIKYSMENVADLEAALPFIFIGAAIALVAISPLFTDVFKYNTYKNNPQYLLKLPRAKFVTIVLFMLAYAVVFMASLTICTLRLSSGNDLPLNDIISCNVRFIATIPNYIAIVAFIQLLSVVLGNEIISVVVYYITISQLFTAKLIVNSMVYETFNINSHLTPLGELFNLGEEDFSVAVILIGVVIGIIYTVVINKFVMKFYKKRVYA